MKPPIILDNRGDLLIFGSANDAVAYVEPIDVENKEYVAYDSEGCLLSLSVRGRWIKRIIIEPQETDPAHGEELRGKLEKFLVHVFVRQGRDPIHLINAPLNDLVATASEFKTR
jgi:hypothetical protein